MNTNLVTRVCDKTGYEFQGTNRQKNHPLVSELLTEMGKISSRYYSKALDILSKCKEMGIPTVEEAVEYTRKAAREEVNAEINAANAKAEKEQKKNDEKWSKIKDENATLKSNGYSFRKVYENLEPDIAEMRGASWGETDYNNYYFEILDPVGNVVERAEALAQISENRVPRAGTKEDTGCITHIRYWNKKDSRIYIGRKGYDADACVYVDGNNWQNKGDVSGYMDDKMWSAVLKLTGYETKQEFINRFCGRIENEY